MSQWATLTLTLAWVIPLIKQGFSVRFHASSPYCTFQKHANSEAHNYVFCCRQSYNVIMITSSKLWNAETHKMDQNPPISNHKPWPIEPIEVNFCFLWGLLRWSTAAKKANVSCLLIFRICMFIKSAVNEIRFSLHTSDAATLHQVAPSSLPPSLPPSLLPVYIIDPSLMSLLIFLLWCRDPDNLFCFACYRL